MMTVLERLAELGLTLPEVAVPAGDYVPAVRTGSLVFSSGQVPMVSGQVQFLDKLGENVTVEEGQQAARLCALNALAAVQAEIGSLERVRRVVKVVGFVASAPDFTEQPQVMNGASELLGALFGPAGKHARSAVGVAALPFGTSVEVELVVEVS